MRRTIAGVLVAGLWLFGANAQGQPIRSEWLRRPITREQVEAIYDRGNWPIRTSTLTPGPPAPRHVALAVWPAKDSELTGLLKKHGRPVIEEALLRRTPGVVPVLRQGLKLRTYSSKSIIKGIGDIPGEESRQALIDLLDDPVAEHRVNAALELIDHKRLPAQLKPKARRIIEAELTSDYRNATHLGPSYLMICEPREAQMHLRAVLDRATKDEQRLRAGGNDKNFWSAKHVRISSTLWLASIGDQSQLQAVRNIAAKSSESGYAIDAIRVLSERYGADERRSLEDALRGPTHARRFAAEYLGVIGDRRSIPALRAAAKTDPLDVANAGWIKTIRGRMLEIADAIQSSKTFSPDFPRLGGPAPWWRR